MVDLEPDAVLPFLVLPRIAPCMVMRCGVANAIAAEERRCGQHHQEHVGACLRHWGRLVVVAGTTS